MALSDAKKGVDVATQHESKCTEAYGMLESQAETMQAKRTTLANYNSRQNNLQSYPC